MSKEQEAKAEHGHEHEVTVFIDGDQKKIPEGSYVVSELKKVLGVSADRELEIVEKQLVPLKDDQTITVHNGEKFVSHVRRGGSGCE